MTNFLHRRCWRHKKPTQNVYRFQYMEKLMAKFYKFNILIPPIIL